MKRTVQDAIEKLQQLDPNEDIVITWWSAEDVEQYSTADKDAEEIWEEVSFWVGKSLDNPIAEVNDFIRAEVEELLEK